KVSTNYEMKSTKIIYLRNNYKNRTNIILVEGWVLGIKERCKSIFCMEINSKCIYLIKCKYMSIFFQLCKRKRKHINICLNIHFVQLTIFNIVCIISRLFYRKTIIRTYRI